MPPKRICPRCHAEVESGSVRTDQEFKCPGCSQILPVRQLEGSVTPTETLPTSSDTPPFVGPATAALPFLSPPQRPDEIGRLGDCRVLKILGQGGMGIVFLAEDLRLERLLALKVMKPEVASSAQARER